MKQLNEFNTLAEAKLYEDIRTRLVSGDMMRKFMIETGLYSYFKLHEQDPQQAAYDNLFGGEFNFIIGDERSVEGLFQLMISEAETPDKDEALTELLSKCLAYANQVYFPYENTTQAQFNGAKGIYTEKEVLNYSYGQSIKITLSESLPENCSASVWECDGDFKPERVGRSIPVHTNEQPYKIKMTGIAVSGKLFVRIPFETDFTVEAI